MLNTNHTDYSEGMKESLRRSLRHYAADQLERLEWYYREKRPDLPEGLALVTAERKARNDHDKTESR
ncbi:hypothetical protein GCM10027189_23570 [Rufibacter soli]